MKVERQGRESGMREVRSARDPGSGQRHVSLREPRLTEAQIIAGAQNAKGGTGGGGVPSTPPIVDGQ